MSQNTTINPKRLTVAQALVRYLAVQYSQLDDHKERLIAGMWGIQGHGNVPGIGQAMQEYGLAHAMPFYRPQNEQAQVHTAAAFARHKNRLSTFACTASVGPGSSNMLTGAALATINRLPVLLLPSDYFANRIPDPVLQQLEHPLEHDVSVNDCFRPVSRFFTRISRPDQLMHALPEAMRVLTDPAETGAVTISIPEDVQTEAYAYPEAMFTPQTWRIRRPLPEPEMIAEIVKILQRAERPMIIAGGGVKYSLATTLLADVAERYGIPVTESQAGKGALPWTHPMAMGNVGALAGTAAAQVAQQADVILAIGTRLQDFTTASMTAFREDVTIIGINVAALDAYKMMALPIVADAKRSLQALSDALTAADYQGTKQEYRQQVRHWRKEWQGFIDETIHIDEPDNLSQAQVLGMTNQIAGGEAVVINAAGSIPGEIAKLWRPTASDAYHIEYGYSCMGYEIPAGLGVRLAEPARDVLVFIGDGSYLMMNSEIVTAVAEGMKLTIVLVDNHGFQSIHGLQRSQGIPHFALELRERNAENLLDGNYVPVDYAKHAEAMGANAIYCNDEAGFRTALQQALASEGVNVVVVEVDPEKRVGNYTHGGWWDCPPPEVSQQASVQQARQDYEEQQAKQVRFKQASNAC